MKDKLVVQEHGFGSASGGYGIYWLCANDEGTDYDIGGALGESLDDVPKSIDDVDKREFSDDDGRDRDFFVATIAASQASPDGRDNCGFYWDSVSAAKRAITKINAARKADAAAQKALKAGKPWPEWAVKAKAEGWRAPKGWVPK